MSVGPVVAALTGVPAGRLADRVGSRLMVLSGLAAVAAGAIALSLIPESWGLAGYIGAVAVTTAGYAMSQAANTAAVRSEHAPNRRGLVWGLLSLLRNLGLVTGASLMGAVFARAVGPLDLAVASPDAFARGLRVTFAVAAMLMIVALALATVRRTVGARPLPIGS